MDRFHAADDRKGRESEAMTSLNTFINKYKIPLIILAIILIFGGGLRNLGILPGFEGLNVGVNGVNINSQYYTIGQTLPTTYSWVSSDVHNTILKMSSTNPIFTSPAEVRIESNTPNQITNPLTPGATIDYWIKNNDGTYSHVKGQVNIYSEAVTVSAINTGNWAPDFQGQQICMDFGAVTWNQALQEQSPIDGATSSYGHAWEAPVAVYIDNCNIISPGDHGRIDPSYSGRQITLYSTHDQSGTIADLSTGNVNNTFSSSSNPIAPDSRMQPNAYGFITLTDFGTTTGILGTSITAPVVDYTFKIYTIQIGVYTYTNPDHTPWSQRPADNSTNPIIAWFNSLFGNLGNLFTSGINTLLILAVVGVVVVIVLSRRH
jgi:hypothetical protein